MSDSPANDATLLLERWRSGDTGAHAQLVELLHDELRTIAARLMRAERVGHTLQPTAVVNEAYLRLFGGAAAPAEGRADLLGLATRVMRQVLVDHARRRDTEKRGGDWQRVSILDDDVADDRGCIDALELDDALKRLAERSPRQAQIAELRYFGGLSIAESAASLGVGVSTVKADWAVARLWLARELGGATGDRPVR